MKKYITTLLAVSCALAAFSMPVSALEYSFDGADAGEFGKPTSVETIYVSREPTNIDRSKNAVGLAVEIAEPATRDADVGDVDIAVDLPGHHLRVGNHGAAYLVGHERQLLQRGLVVEPVGLLA